MTPTVSPQPPMDLNTKRKTMVMLKVLDAAGRPMGSAALSRALNDWGINLRERQVRNYLARTDLAGFTTNLGRRGRALTDAGRRELQVGIAVDNVGSVASRLDELAYRMTFDHLSQTGSVIVNCSFVEARMHLRDILHLIQPILDAQLGMGRRLLILPHGHNPLNLQVPHDRIALATVCSVTLNGIFLRRGIAMTSRFGGLLEMRDGQPLRFRHIIHYDATTLDPLEIFIRGHMTSVLQAARTGTGIIGASFREIPSVALDDALAAIRAMQKLGLGTVVRVGKPNCPLLDVPVTPGRVGLIVAGGLNPIAAFEEIGLPTESTALHSLCQFSHLQPIDSLLRHDPTI